MMQKNNNKRKTTWGMVITALLIFVIAMAIAIVINLKDEKAQFWIQTNLTAISIPDMPEITVNKVEEEKPEYFGFEIKLLGEVTMTLEQGDEFVDPGFRVEDKEGVWLWELERDVIVRVYFNEIIDSNINEVLIQSIDTEKIGEYTIKYILEKEGIKQTMIRTVRVYAKKETQEATSKNGNKKETETTNSETDQTVDSTISPETVQQLLDIISSINNSNSGNSNNGGNSNGGNSGNGNSNNGGDSNSGNSGDEGNSDSGNSGNNGNSDDGGNSGGGSTSTTPVTPPVPGEDDDPNDNNHNTGEEIGGGSNTTTPETPVTPPVPGEDDDPNDNNHNTGEEIGSGSNSTTSEIEQPSTSVDSSETE